MARRRLARWYAAANRRRAELIGMLPECGGPGVSAAERAEYEALQKRCLDEVNRVHPPPDLHLDDLERLEARLRMTEADWLASEGPAAMLLALQDWQVPGGISGSWGPVKHRCLTDRKLRLFACACCRLVWDGKVCPECRGERLKWPPNVWNCKTCGNTGRVGGLTDPRSRRAVEVADRFADGLETGDELRAAWAAVDSYHNAAYERRTTPVSLRHASLPALGEQEMSAVWIAMWVCNADARADQIAEQTCSAQHTDSAAQAALLRDIFGNPWRPAASPWLCEFGEVIRQPDEYTIKRSLCDCVPTPSLPRWLTPTVLALARAAYDERRGEWRCVRCGPVQQVAVYRAEGGGHGHAGCWQKAEYVSDGLLDPHRLAVLADALEEAGCEEEAILRHLRGYSRSWAYETDPDSPRHADWVDYGWQPSDAPHARGCWAVDLILGKE